MKLLTDLVAYLLGATFHCPATCDRASRRPKVSSGTRSSRQALLCLEQLEDRVTPSLSAVGNTTTFPYSATVDVEATFWNGHQFTTMHGSGAMVDSFHVLTAGHMIYDWQLGGFATKIVVTPGLNGNSDPFGSATMVWERVYSQWEWASQNHPGYDHPGDEDIGLITLNKAIGNSTGWFGMYYWNTNDPSQLDNIYGSMSLNTTGYPGAGYRLNNGQVAQGNVMYHDFGRVTGVTPDGSLLEYPQIETHPGQSGSPVYYYDGKSLSSIGIDAVEVTYGLGTRITAQMYNDFHAAMNYDAANRPPQSNAASGPQATVSSMSYDAQADLTVTTPNSSTAALVDQPPPAPPAAAVTTIGLSPAVPAVQAGQAATFIANVANNGSTSPTGTVTFYDGTTPLGTVDLVGNLWGAVATLTTTALAVGDHTITAVYNGDSQDQSSSATATESVTPAQTTTTLNASAASVQTGQAVTFTASVANHGSASPSGTVTFYDGTTPLGTVSLTGNTATLTTTGLAAGKHTITAVYNGDSNDLSSTAAAITDTVTAPLPPPAKLALVASALTHSFESYSDFVTAAYQKYLGRTASTTEVAGWAKQMQNGLSDERVEAGFIGSLEYIDDHGGPGAGWVTSMYVDLLGRTPAASEVAGWVVQLNHGMAPTAVAYGFAASYERESDRVAADYQKYLGRAASAAEIAGWVSHFLAGYSNETLIAGFVGSQEFWNDQGSNPNSWLEAAYQDILGRPADQVALADWLPLLT